MATFVSAAAVVARLRDAGFESYLAGGCVRDRLLGRPAADYDVATAALPAQVTALFPRTVEVGAAFGVVRVVTDDGEYEVATFRTEGPYLDGRHPSSVEFAGPREDAQRRDFTINGLFLDPAADAVLDFVGGRADLTARVVRAIGDPARRFEEDRLRMLRALRLAAELDFAIEAGTFEAVRRHAGDIGAVSAERVRDELVRMLTGPDPGRALSLLRDTGLLAAVLPEIAAEIGVPQPAEFHPEGDVFEHTRLAVAALRAPSPALAMAALLHDAGKPGTLEYAPDRIRFSRHDERGVQIAEAVMARLRFPRRDIDRATALVGRHMVFKDLPQMREAKRRRLFADEMFPDLLELHRADCAASHGDLMLYDWARAEAARIAESPPAPAPLATGHDVLARGVPPGPRVGAILEAVEDARLEGRIRTREEALALIDRLAGEGGGTEPAPGRGDR
ncbi:MAG TPA: CCA tRNA nucleotidyltransferase [bacterium]|nr:CCA tRNA nucleotidyltransferase [bacterium]